MSLRSKLLIAIVAVLAVACAYGIPDARSTAVKTPSNFKPQRFAQMSEQDSAPKKAAKKAKSEDKVPSVSVAFKCVITLVSLHFFATFVDLALNSRERALRLFNVDPDTHHTKDAAKAVSDAFFLEELKDAQKGMEEAVTEVAMVCIIIIFSHYRIVLDCGYMGEKAKAEYPSDIEKAFWLATAVIVVEFCFVFLAMLLTIMGDNTHESIRKCSSVFMDFVLFTGEFCTIGAIIFMLYKVLTEERRAGYTGLF